MRILVSDACGQLIDAIPVAQRDEENNPEDVLKTEEMEDDLNDGLRYLVVNAPASVPKPYDIKLREEVKKAIGDPEMPNYNYAHQVHMRMEETRNKQIENVQGRSATMRNRMRRYVK